MVISLCFRQQAWKQMLAEACRQLFLFQLDLVQVESVGATARWGEALLGRTSDFSHKSSAVLLTYLGVAERYIGPC